MCALVLFYSPPLPSGYPHQQQVLPICACCCPSGDGTCRFLLMVVAALRRAALELGRTAAPSHGLPAKASSVSRPRVCAALLQLAHSATVQPPRESVSGDANPAALWDTCRQLLRCHLYNNYAPDVVDALADVAVAWLREAAGPHGAEPGGVLRAATQLLAEFPVVLADRGRLNASTVWPVGDPLVGGSLCRRHLLRTRRLQRTKWVVFRCALDGEHASAGGRGTPATVMVSSAHGLDAAVSFRALAADRLAGRLRRAGVTVVLCTLGVSDAFASVSCCLWRLRFSPYMVGDTGVFVAGRRATNAACWLCSWLRRCNASGFVALRVFRF